MESLCVICGKSFKGKRELTKHTNNVHDTSEHPCDICWIFLLEDYGSKITKILMLQLNVTSVKKTIPKNSKSTHNCGGLVRESFCHKSNSGAKKQQTDNQTGRLAPWWEHAGRPLDSIFLSLLFLVLYYFALSFCSVVNSWDKGKN